ncbi:MAG: hypothetical protein J0H14_04890 [Alphaproteobacteria bacterium]|nr:hypothetical protein [Alphaproteobacteria bacterium]
MTTENEILLHRVCLSAKRALSGQTPATLRAYSFAIDRDRKIVRLRAHFAESPSDDALDLISVVDTEIFSDFPDLFETETEIQVSPAGTPPSFLSGGIAYLREGEPGTCCS